LVGWLSDNEALQVLLGHNVLPTDDITGLQDIIAACRTAVTSRPAFAPSDPISDIPDRSVADAMSARPDIRAALGDLHWRPAMVDLRGVLTFQKIISTEGLDERIAAARTSTAALWDLCLPADQPLPPQGALIDGDQKGYTISSLNPNLRIMGGHVQEAQVQVSPDPNIPPQRALGVTVFLTMGAPYLQVVRHQNRCFIRDGNHRAAGLLRAKINTVPCIVIEARSFDDVGWMPGMLPYEVLFSDRPARLADLWDDAVAQDVARPTIRKVVRVRGDEFVVPL
jgi:hypothetical protein